MVSLWPGCGGSSGVVVGLVVADLGLDGVVKDLLDDLLEDEDLSEGAGEEFRV